MSNFSCSHCHRVCEWNTREPVEVTERTEVKTIGGRYCNAAACIDAAAEAHFGHVTSDSVEKTKALHARDALRS